MYVSTIIASGPQNAITFAGNLGSPVQIRTATAGQETSTSTTGNQLLSVNAGASGELDLNTVSSGPIVMGLSASSNVGIKTASPALPLDVNGAAQFGAGPTKSTFTIVGGLFIAAGSSLTLSGAKGFVTSASSVTASAFFGDGSHLTGVIATLPNTINSSFTVTGAGGILAESTVTANSFFLTNGENITNVPTNPGNGIEIEGAVLGIGASTVTAPGYIRVADVTGSGVASNTDIIGASGIYGAAPGERGLIEIFPGTVTGAEGSGSGNAAALFMGAGNTDGNGGNLFLDGGIAGGTNIFGFNAGINYDSGDNLSGESVGGAGAQQTTSGGETLSLNINGDGIQTITLSSDANGNAVAADIQAKVRALTASIPSNQYAFSGFVAAYKPGLQLYDLIAPGDPIGFNISSLTVTGGTFAPLGKLGVSNGGTEISGSIGSHIWSLGQGIVPGAVDALVLDTTGLHLINGEFDAVSSVTAAAFIGGSLDITDDANIGGSVVGESSVTASAFFGDGSHLTGITFDGGTVANTTTFLSSVTINGANGLLVSGASVTASAFFGDGSQLTNLSIPAEISVSTIDATSTTPFGGVNITTNVIVSGNLFVPTGNVGLNTPPDPLRTLKISQFGLQRALTLQTFDAGTQIGIDYLNGAIGSEYVVGEDQFGNFDFFDENGPRHPVFMQRSNGFVGINTISPGYQLDVFGDVNINGTLTKSAGSFQIEDPMDPHKLLLHGFVESPEYGLIYRGSAKLIKGEAVITLPAYFELIVSSASRTVQLTCKGGWSPLYYADIVNGKLTVKTTRDGNQSQEFSWMVQGERKDSYVKEHPLQISKNKPTEKIKKSDWARLTTAQQHMKRWAAEIVITPD